MTTRPVLSGRMLWGVIVLSLGVLWTLDNLGQIDASQVVRWWPAVALAWGLSLLTGMSGRRNRLAGWIWTIVGGVSLLRPLGIADINVFDLWPMLLIVAGGMLVLRAWKGQPPAGNGGVTGPRFDATAIFAGSQRKVVTQEFSVGDVTAIIAGTTLDFRSARLLERRGVVDVFAIWGGIDLIVPPEWRVVCEVTPILGVFQDGTTLPADPDAPTLVVRGSVVMGGIEVRNDERKAIRVRVRGRDQMVRVGPGGIVRVGVMTGRDLDPETPPSTPRASGTEKP
jgi:hypothetical protein